MWPCSTLQPRDFLHLLSHSNIGTNVIKLLDLNDRRNLRLVATPLKAAVDSTVEILHLDQSDAAASVGSLLNTSWDIKGVYMLNKPCDFDPNKLMQILSAAPAWPKLTVLDLTQLPDSISQQQKDEIKALVTARNLSPTNSLRKLVVPTLGINDADIKRLSQTPWAGTLNRINLEGNAFGHKGVKIIMEGIQELVELELAQNSALGNELLEVLKSKPLTKLEELDIRNNGITDAQRIVELCRELTSLERLYLTSNTLNNNGLKTLGTGVFPNLLVLEVGNCGFDGEGLAHLVSAGKRAFPKLTSLALDENILGISGMEALALNPWELGRLFIGTCELGRPEVAALAKGRFEHLIRLELDGNTDLDAEALIPLALYGYMPRLNVLNLKDTAVDDPDALAAEFISAFQSRQR